MTAMQPSSPPSKFAGRSALLSAVWLLLPAVAMIGGCGGDDVVKPPPRKVAPVRKVAVAPAAPGRKRNKKTSNKLAGKQAGRGRVDAKIPPKIEEPENTFLVLGPDSDFERINPPQAVRPQDLFLVQRPAKGVDASTFEIVERGTGERAETETGAGARANKADPEFQLPTGFIVVTKYGYSADGLPRRIRNEGDGGLMALVPAGVFLMGSDSGSPNARPEVQIDLDAYYIDVTEVTVAQFELYRRSQQRSKTTSKRRRRTIEPPLNVSSSSDDPALGILWRDARAYARWFGKDLPTEAEWEKAARGSAGYLHVWGNGRAIWARHREPKQIDPVASFRTDVSPYGLYDLAGNAREWCLDRYSSKALSEVAARKDAILRNWQGPKLGIAGTDLHVVKGNGPQWEAWQRAGLGLRTRAPDVGFRCVLRISPPPSKTSDRTPRKRSRRNR